MATVAPVECPDICRSSLAAARKRAGLTVSELSRLSGLSERQIHRLERNLNTPGHLTRKALAGALRMEMHELWPQHTPPPPVAIGGPRPASLLDAAVWAYRQAGDSTGAGELLSCHSDRIRIYLNQAGAQPRPRGGSNRDGIESLASWARKLGVPVATAVAAALAGRVPGAFVQDLECPVIGVRWAVRRTTTHSQGTT